MPAFMEFYHEYLMGSAQMLTGFYFFARFLQKKVRPYYYVLFAVFGLIILKRFPCGGILEFLVYVLLLIASGILVCHADRKAVVLYAALTVAMMQLSFGIINAISGMCYPRLVSTHPYKVAAASVGFGNLSLLLTGLCCHMACRYFIYYENVQKQYVFLVLIPVGMIFFMGQFIGSAIYGNVSRTDCAGLLSDQEHYQLLVIQLFGMASIFCIMSAYKKLLQNVSLRTELSLLEQEEHFLHQYVEEAKARYEKTTSFRHDMKNHLTVIKELLQNQKACQALSYIQDLEELTEALSFPCSTNHPMADLLLGNKLGIAKSMGIAVSCSLVLPDPCFVRNIDLCIILSNALDNAIHACQKMETGAEPYIHVTGCIQGEFLLLEFQNSFRGSGLIQRGTGLSNIRAVAEKYRGAIHIRTQNHKYILNVLLIISQHPERISQQSGSFAVCEGRKR